MQLQKLHVAIFKNSIGKVNKAIATGVKVTESTLFRAIESGSIDIVNAVIKAGAPVTTYILDMAIHSKNIDIVNAVITAGVPMLPDALERAIYTLDANIVQAIINEGAPIDSSAIKLAEKSGVQAIIEAIKIRLEYIEDVKKNSRTLAFLQRDAGSHFSKLSTETLVKISSLLGNDKKKIKNDKEAFELAFNNFDTLIPVFQVTPVEQPVTHDLVTCCSRPS